MATGQRLPFVCLPEPYKTRYQLKTISQNGSQRNFKLVLAEQQNEGLSPPQPLDHKSLTFTEPISIDRSNTLADSDNTSWAIAQRAPTVCLSWQSNLAPTVGQIWIVIYAIVSLRMESELFTVSLAGNGKESLIRELQAVGLARAHPVPSSSPRRRGHPALEAFNCSDYPLVVSQAAFWQGAGSPFGPRPAWVASPSLHDFSRRVVGEYPLPPLEYTLTTKLTEPQVHTHHPVRPAKPSRGALIYSRYIPHLDEFFSMVLLDYTNPEHLQLFHQWQNDPRVAKGWNETGTLDQHREYLRRIDEDPHQIAVLARFNDTFFAYFEVYWAKEDHLGAYYDAGDFDRGRHSLVGDARFRGAHRVMAWWSSLVHYIFLDDPRTQCVVGEPKYVNATVLAYDFAHGFNVEKLIDLPHKRSAFVRCSRDKFFQLSPFRFDEGLSLSGGKIKSNPDRILKL
ncbi:hypothetical protein MPDQ_002895 [Monascus purpureus]|uniref:Acyltransferase MbtK/IucB-like conserved domain-containing protein n=1 Tax=Monascus purpureus TaxID=5098 RepID=A0A507QNL1_MONPU|nr:hypothetical protein MPDQ_002895 [Monascus purpureus]